MRKKVLFFLLLLGLLIPSSLTVLAEEIQLTYKTDFSFSGRLLEGTPENIFDNNTTTFARIATGESFTISLSDSIELRKLTSIKLASNGTPLNFTVEAYDSSGNRIYRNTNFGNLLELDVVGVSKLVFTNSTGTWSRIFDMRIYGEFKISYDEVGNLSFKADHEKVLLSFNPSLSAYYTGALIYKDGVLLTTVDSTTKQYTDTKVTSGKTYIYKVTALYSDGTETNGVTKEVTIPLPPEPPKEVTQVKVESLHNRVNLSWSLPEQNDFKHVNIYREIVSHDTSSIKGYFLGTTAFASTKIFETNGTYFNDLTVQENTDYEYILTTQTTDGRESEGVQVLASTPKKPVPEIEGGGYEENENGDFLFKWTSPTTGKVKVLIDGKEYKTVNAALKQILIPKEDMVYDIWKNPKVSLVPVSETGEEGTPTKPGESGGSGGIGSSNLPFGVTDLLKSIMGLLGVIAPILLLSLAIIFFKPIKNLIVKAIQNNRERKMYR